MTTKKNPGKFNCYAKLDDDEPYFVLRGKDPVAPYLVLAWREIRSGNVDAAKSFMDIAMKNPQSDPTWLTDERIREINHGDDAMRSDIEMIVDADQIVRVDHHLDHPPHMALGIGQAPRQRQNAAR